MRAYADASLLDDIASRGLAAHDAGPEVVKLLRHPDLEIRLKAVEALGAIGYEESADELVPLLWVSLRLSLTVQS